MDRSEISARHASELAALGVDYWWFAVRLLQVRAAIAAHAPGRPASHLDLGCGAGATLEALLQGLRPERALGIDGTDAALAAATARGLPVAYADLREPLALPFAPALVTALDVLEHLDDDARTLRHLADAAAPEALLVATVPAFRFLWSRWDDVAGHRRRYDRPALRRVLVASGWQPLRIRYFFSFSLPPAFVQRRLLRRVDEFEFPRVPPALNRLLTLLGRLEQAAGNPAPFGTSLLAIARRAPRPAGGRPERTGASPGTRAV